MRISDWSSDVCSSDPHPSHGERPLDQLIEPIGGEVGGGHDGLALAQQDAQPHVMALLALQAFRSTQALGMRQADGAEVHRVGRIRANLLGFGDEVAEQGKRIVRGGHGLSRKAMGRSEEHTSELQSLMRISYAVFCLKKKNKKL